MKNKLMILGCMITMLACTPAKERVSTIDPTSHSKMVSQESDDKMVESEIQTELEDTFSDEKNLGKSLNDIRFAGWTDKDWLDNAYIRELRKHVDAYLDGQMPNRYPEDYKEYVKGKFAIVNIEPYLMGGVFIQFCFIENPNKIFSAWVYSDVDEEKEKVLGYDCKSIQLEEYTMDLTKEEILKIIEEHPENKLW
ncbi:MAG: hypothetical protein IKW43_08960 [Bacteroidaceae bacterium]|nr:hypothetical protein [Bacteroidaceae bacterium]